MKKKTKIAAAVIALATMLSPGVNAMSTMNYNFVKGQKYRIMIDGDKYTVPDTVTYSDGYVYDMGKYKTFLQTQSSNTTALTYSNGVLTYNGGVCSASISKESNPLIDTSKGIFNSNPSNQRLIDYFEYYIMMNKRAGQLQTTKDELETATDGAKIFECNVKISNFTDDIKRMAVINAPAQTTVIGSIPYLAESYSLTDAIPQGTESIVSTINVKYYLNSLIMRDLRLYNIKYNINNGEYITVPGFNRSTYVYSIRLPDTTPNNAVIKTQSSGTMEMTMKQNQIPGYDKMGITINDTTIQLRNGYGMGKVRVVFDISQYPDSDTYAENPVREYTVVFTNKDFIKGDMDKNGVINGTDASIVLDKYNKNNATAEDVLIGDMDENGVLNGTDASMILDMYNKGL